MSRKPSLSDKFKKLEVLLKARQRTEQAYKGIIALVIGNFAFLNILAARELARAAITSFGKSAVIPAFGAQFNIGVLLMVVFSFISLFVLIRFAGKRMKEEKELAELIHKESA